MQDITVRSAAKAAFVEKGKSHEEVWNWITGMFYDPSGGNSKSFIAGGWNIEPLSNGVETDSMEGKVFRYIASLGSEYHVEIETWVPHRSLVYTEKYHTTSNTSPPMRMEFTLSDHPDGTEVEIERVEVGVLTLPVWIAHKVFGVFTRNICVGRLAFILNGNSFPMRKSYVDGKYTIRRTA